MIVCVAEPASCCPNFFYRQPAAIVAAKHDVSFAVWQRNTAGANSVWIKNYSPFDELTAVIFGASEGGGIYTSVAPQDFAML
jgi:hypothetical protein